MPEPKVVRSLCWQCPKCGWMEPYYEGDAARLWPNKKRCPEDNSVMRVHEVPQEEL